jgi:hypothetical protein
MDIFSSEYSKDLRASVLIENRIYFFSEKIRLKLYK